MSRLRGDKDKSNHFSVGKIQIERAQNVLHQALGELSVDCELWDNGRAYYDAHNVLGLFSGPPGEATEEIVEMMDNNLSELVPRRGPPQRHVPRPGIRHHQFHGAYLQYR